MSGIDARLRAQLPILEGSVAERPLVYLDHGATSLTPEPVLDAVSDYYRRFRANIHRGKHALTERASSAFEDARRSVARFLQASPNEIVFTQGTTDGINQVAFGLGFSPGDNVVTTWQEHHSNLLPWMQHGAELRLAEVDEHGVIDPSRVLELVDERTRLIAVSHGSNLTGALHPVEAVADGARERGIPVLVDAAQTAAHLPLRPRRLGVDYVAFSGHKALGPTGIGVLWGTREALDRLTPMRAGGGAVKLVEPPRVDWKDAPARLEAGTPNIGGAIGLGAAVDLLRDIGMDAVAAHGAEIASALVDAVHGLEGLHLLGPPPGAARLPLVSLVVDIPGVSADHLALMLSDSHAVMTRSGHHCCHPYLDHHGWSATLRASAGPYTSLDDVARFGDALAQVLAGLRR